jgi:alpha,alpha-trehalase
MNPSKTADPVADYIDRNFDRSIYHDEPGTGFGGVDLPYPYTSPCIRGEGHFYFFFYWDTHFTNLGLLRTGRVDQARDNIRNMLWLIDRHGFMPNHVGLDNRSQSPYLCRMVKDYFAHIGGPEADPVFFRECAEGLRREFHFWRNARCTPVGLFRHGHQETEAGCEAFYAGLVRRLGLPADAPRHTKVQVGSHYLANAEATCDYSSRFEGRTLDYCQVDLNALLYEYAITLRDWAARLGWEPGFFDKWALRLRERMNELMWSEPAGLFLDYDFVNRRHSPVPAQTGFQTLYCGLATPAQAERMVASLPLFERAHGMAYTPEHEGCRTFQWAYPNVWPPMVSMLMEGLLRYGYRDDARRLAGKYVATTRALFERTGQLWEKTDAETGEVAGGEYAAAPMIGWSAGVYLQAREILEKKSIESDNSIQSNQST